MRLFLYHLVLKKFTEFFSISLFIQPLLDKWIRGEKGKITLSGKELTTCRTKIGRERLETQICNVLLTTPFLGFAGVASHLPQNGFFLVKYLYSSITQMILKRSKFHTKT